MKETISVNLASQAFTFDKDAYRRLKEYLDAIRRRLPAGDPEILNDVEARLVQDFIADDGRYPSDGAGSNGSNGRSIGVRRAADRGEAGRGVRGCGECLVRQFPALVPFADESFDRRRVRRNR
jgi:hypothetical protein